MCCEYYLRVCAFFLVSLIGPVMRITYPYFSSATGHGKIVVCYLSVWAVYRPSRGSFAIENIEPHLCTHIVYAFAGLDEKNDGIQSMDEWQDLPDNHGRNGYGRIVALKKRFPHLKVSLAIGGWNEGSVVYSQMVLNSTRRERFVRNASLFLRKHKFDGLDLDWEYPTQRGGIPEDRENLVALVRELHIEFQSHNLLLTAAIGVDRKLMDAAYDLPVLSNYLDYIHIMSYEYGGYWDGIVSASAPLHSNDILNVCTTVEYMLSLGTNAAKMVLGVPFYGRSFITLPGLTGRLGDAVMNGFAGPYTQEIGFLGYNEICAMSSDPRSGWSSEFDEDCYQSVARRHNKTSDEWQMVTYDSMRSVAAKARLVVHHRLAGMMAWSVDTDDFHGECLMEQDIYADFPRVERKSPPNFLNFPLLRTLNEAIGLAIEEVQTDLKDAMGDFYIESRKEQQSADVACDSIQ